MEIRTLIESDAAALVTASANNESDTPQRLAILKVKP
jgi:hypothetical protein